LYSDINIVREEHINSKFNIVSFGMAYSFLYPENHNETNLNNTTKEISLMSANMEAWKGPL